MSRRVQLIIAVSALALAAWIVSTTARGSTCSWTEDSFSPLWLTVSASATGFPLTVTAPGCTWTAVSNTPEMVTIASGANGTDSGIVDLSISENTSPDDRAGTLSIGDRTYQVRQRGLASIGPADLDADGRADLVVWTPSTGTWSWLTTSSGFTVSASKQWGNQSMGDIPLLGDIDGDGKADLVVWRRSTGTWFWLTSSTDYNYAASGSVQWGNSSLGDQPMLGDMDGDGRADLVVWRASTGTWFWLLSSSAYAYSTAGSIQWGSTTLGDQPLLGDLDGDGMADPVVWRAWTGTWYWLLSSRGYDYAAADSRDWGSAGSRFTGGDQPLLGDLDGDGKSDLVIFRGQWLWLSSANDYAYPGAGTPFSTFTVGPHAFLADMDGDGRADLLTWGEANCCVQTWNWLPSSSGYAYTSGRQQQWGLQTDIK